MKHFIIFLLALGAVPLAAQSCFEISLQKGQTAYNNGDYAKAAQFWQTGKECEGADIKKLNSLIWKTRDDDGDGYVNGRDKCPKASYASNGGCPPAKPKDRDEDNTPDLNDKCPDKYGPSRFGGCPDTDGDETPDYQDLCPNTVGPKRTSGCPDRDGDGIADKDDACPEEAGTSTTKGCPLPPPDTQPIVPSDIVLIRGGNFTMGDLFNEGPSDEKPTHSVTLRDFYIGKYEVTFDEFDAFCTATGREKPGDRDWGRGSRPVINVDWYDAVEYCNWRSQKESLSTVYTIDKTRKDPNNQNNSDTKKWIVTMNQAAKGYRLPTEAEWEYAAREGGKKVRFGNGRDIINPAEINFGASASYKKDYSIEGEYRQKTVSVDNLSANSLGLKHMSGNVWEWCADWYGDTYYAESDGAIDPTGAKSGQYRVLRGGSWDYDSGYCRAAYRSGYPPLYRHADLGFRVVRGY
jgi:formylglycine-generating enzyme required for sulfatase activity